MNAAFAKLSSTQRRAAWTLLPATVILCMAIGELVSVARYGGDVPTDSDWRRASEYVAGEMGPDDLVVVAPYWLDPRLRQFLGKQISVEMAARMDRERFADIWVAQARGATAPESSGQSMRESKEFGALRVTRFAHTKAVIETDFLFALPGAEVSGGWRTRPAVTLDEVGYRPRRCIRGEPMPGAHPAIVFRDVTLGSSLVGYVGLADVFTRRDVRSPIALSVTVNGDEVANVSAGVDDGWVRFEVPTQAQERAVVGFHPRAVDAKRLLCFAAEARR